MDALPAQSAAIVHSLRSADKYLPKRTQKPCHHTAGTPPPVCADYTTISPASPCLLPVLLQSRYIADRSWRSVPPERLTDGSSIVWKSIKRHIDSAVHIEVSCTRMQPVAIAAWFETASRACEQLLIASSNCRDSHSLLPFINQAPATINNTPHVPGTGLVFSYGIPVLWILHTLDRHGLPAPEVVHTNKCIQRLLLELLPVIQVGQGYIIRKT